MTDINAKFSLIKEIFKNYFLLHRKHCPPPLQKQKAQNEHVYNSTHVNPHLTYL